MSLPPTETHPDDPSALPPARRRRAHRRLISGLTADERANYVETVIKRASPTFDFFLFSLLSGAILVAGLILDSPYVLLLGALLAPLMAPVVGISLGTVLGSARVFARALGGFLVGSFLVLLVGAIGGFGVRIWLPMELLQAHLFAQLTWPPFIVVAVGAVLTAATIAHDKFNATVSSVALSYGLYIPIVVAGFGLGSGLEFLWPDGLVVYALHLAWAALVGAGALAVMGFRPQTLFGYSIGGAIALVIIILAIGTGGAGFVFAGNVALPTPIPSATPSPTPSLTPTNTPIPPSATLTSTLTPTQTETPTLTPTQSPTPVQAIVIIPEGVVLRSEPGGEIIAFLGEGSLLEVLPDPPVRTDDGQVWVHVIALEQNIEGWIVQSLIATATPVSTEEPLPPTVTVSPTQ